MRLANREATHGAIADAVSAAAPQRRAGAGGTARRRARTPTTAANEDAITAIETRALRATPRPALPRGLGSRSARAARGDARHRPHGRGRSTGFASSGDGLPDAELLERLLVGARPPPDRGRPRDLRDGRLPRRTAVDGRGGGLGPRRAGARTSRSGGSSAAASERLLAYASTGELVAPDERARRVVALRERASGRSKIRFHHADWREDVEVVERVREAVGDDVELMVDANQGWRMPGDRSSLAGTSPPRRSARARSNRSASTGSRSRCAPTTSTATRRFARSRRSGIAAGEMVRSAHGGARPRPARRRRRHPAGRRARRRHRRLPAPCGVSPTSAAACSRRTPGRTASASSRTSTWRWPSRPARTSRCRTTRPRGRRNARDSLLPAPLEIAADGTIAPAARPGPRRHPRPRRARGLPRRMSEPLTVRAAVLRTAGEPAPSKRSRSTRPGTARCSSSSRPPASATPTSTSPTGISARRSWPIVLGHEGAGVVEAVGAGVQHVEPGDHVSLCFVPSCGACRACRAGRPNLCEPRPRRPR